MGELESVGGGREGVLAPESNQGLLVGQQQQEM